MLNRRGLETDPDSQTSAVLGSFFCSTWAWSWSRWGWPRVQEDGPRTSFWLRPTSIHETINILHCPPNEFHGWLAEAATHRALHLALDRSIYRPLHNLIIPARGGSAQIAHVVISVYGIFVVETKNWSGRIFCRAEATEWMQEVLGTPRAIPNPLRQNHGHIQALAAFLHYGETVFENVIFFAGHGAFSHPMPANVLSSGLAPYIQGFRSARLTGPQAEEAASRLRV